MSLFYRLKRFAAVLFIAAYLLLTAFYFGRHAIGDSGRSPFGYFWTWDMFPNYPTESSRRSAMGETASGAFVRLVPNADQRFRWGVNGDVMRFDIDHRLPFLRRAALDAAFRYNAAASDDPLRRVYLTEKYWPPKFNLPDELYREFYQDSVTEEVYWATPQADGTDAERFYWRVLDEVPVGSEDDGLAREPSP